MQSPGPDQKQASLIPQPEGEDAFARDGSGTSELTQSTEVSPEQDMELEESRTPDATQHTHHARNPEHRTPNSPPSLMQRKFMAAEKAEEDFKADWNRRVIAIQEGMEEDRKRKEWYFFYGSLMDPAQLQRVLGLRDRPRNLVPAEIVGYHIQMWGPYPTLLDGPPGNVVKGMAYEVEGGEYKDRLAAYETNNYQEHKCTIRLEGGARVSGTTFEWVGDMGELKDGSFDLRDWQMAHLLED
jgi:hypothetical protein